MFSMLYEANFTYDSSMPIYENKPPSFPYTMDYQLAHDCMIPPCPNRWRNHKPMKTDSDQGLPWGVGGSVGDVERPEGGTMQHGWCLQQPQHCRGKEHPLIWNQEALSITFFLAKTLFRSFNDRSFAGCLLHDHEEFPEALQHQQSTLWPLLPPSMVSNGLLMLLNGKD